MSTEIDASKLNGSVERLAHALRDVVRECVAEAIEPLEKDVSSLKRDVAQQGMLLRSIADVILKDKPESDMPFLEDE